MNDEYINLYDLIEWASEKHYTKRAAAEDLLALLKGKELQLYRRIEGIKPRIEKDNTKLEDALLFVQINNGYEITFDDDIPF